MLTFRSLQKKDVPEIRKLALRAWLFTYEDIWADKQIRKEVAQFYSGKNFKRYFSKIKENKDYFVVVLDKKKIVGYAHVGKKGNKWELFRIYKA